MFEKAARQKLRFSSSKGLLNAEDLWDLSLPQLDAIYKQLNVELKKAEGESLLDTNTTDKSLELRIEIVKHVFKVKNDEKISRENASERAAQKQKIMNIIAEKENENLKNMTVEDLQKLKDSM